MRAAALEVREFLDSLEPAWRIAVLDPVTAEFDDVWESPDMLPDVCRNLVIVSALTVLAFYDCVVRKDPALRHDARIDGLIDRLLRNMADPLKFTAGQGLTVLEWALECDAIPMVRRGTLKAKHVMFLNTLARERSDAHHMDYQHYFMETAKVPVEPMVSDVLKAITFMQDLRPSPDRRFYARFLGTNGKGRSEVEFPLAPFFAPAAHDRPKDLVPFWRYDSGDSCYVYVDLVTNVEVRRRRTTRGEGSKNQHLVTALLSSSFRPLAELIRIASHYLKQKENKHSLRTLLGHGAPNSTAEKAFCDDAVLGTWKLLTVGGPIALLEMDPALAELVFREVYYGDDDAAVRAIEERATEAVPAGRLLAIEAARQLGLDVHEAIEMSEIERMLHSVPKVAALDEVSDEDLADFTDACVSRWNREIERELRFLIVFYSSLPYCVFGKTEGMGADDVEELFKGAPKAVNALRGLLKHQLNDPSVRSALRTLTGRENPMEERIGKAIEDLLKQIVSIRNTRVAHAGRPSPDLRGEMHAFLTALKDLLELLSGKNDPVHPIHPYLLQFQAATFTSGGLTTMRYVVHFGGEKSKVEVYTSQHIDLARAYYCLPRVSQSDLSRRHKDDPQAKLLVDPFLIDTAPIDALVRRLLGEEGTS